MKRRHADKPIHFPTYTRFDQFFELAEEGWSVAKAGQWGSAQGKISGYLHHRGGRALYVKPTDEILADIQDNMISVDYDSIYFEIVDHDNGCSLVIAKYNQIIGSRYLGYIKTDTIPREAA